MENIGPPCIIVRDTVTHISELVGGWLFRSLNERPEMQCPVLVFSLVIYYPSLNTL